jgi:hypothetical protein
LDTDQGNITLLLCLLRNVHSVLSSYQAKTYQCSMSMCLTRCGNWKIPCPLNHSFQVSSSALDPLFPSLRPEEDMSLWPSVSFLARQEILTNWTRLLRFGNSFPTQRPKIHASEAREAERAEGNEAIFLLPPPAYPMGGSHL